MYSWWCRIKCFEQENSGANNMVILATSIKFERGKGGVKIGGKTEYVST